MSASRLAPLCAGCSSAKQVRGTVACCRLERLIDRQVWPAVQQDYGRLRRPWGCLPAVRPRLAWAAACWCGGGSAPGEALDLLRSLPNGAGAQATVDALVRGS
jgi:hypothetical protein